MPLSRLPGVRRVRFGTFELDLESGDLRKAGAPIRLRGQPVQILATLIQRPGELVTREELRQQLWPADTFVDFEHGLNTAMKRLRAALGDDAEAPRFVETLPRRGYRFIAPVDLAREVARPTPETSGPRRTRPGSPAIAAMLAMAALVALSAAAVWISRTPQPPSRPGAKPITSLAVLPLQNLSSNPDEDYFADGLTDALITSLAKIGSLKVISRTSAMAFKGARKPLPDIARNLGVDAIVEGTVQHAGDRVRITAQLIHAASDTHLWSEAYERDLREVLVLQAEVARAIAQEIGATLTAFERTTGSAPRRVDPEAHEAYLKGRFHLLDVGTEEALGKSLEFFNRAIARDPKYAPAYAGLAHAYLFLSSYGTDAVPPHETIPKARAAATRALELDQELAAAHAVVGSLHAEYDWDWAGAEQAFARAMALDPSDSAARVWYGQLLSRMGRHTEAVKELQRAREQDPLSPFVTANLANAHLLAGDPGRALEQARAILDTHPDFVVAHWIMADAYTVQRRYDEALPAMERVLKLAGGSASAQAGYAHLSAIAGRRDLARQTLRELEEKARSRYVSPYLLAHVAAGLDDRARAFQWLEQARMERASGLAWILVDPTWDGMRDDPRYLELLRRMGIGPR